MENNHQQKVIASAIEDIRVAASMAKESARLYDTAIAKLEQVYTPKVYKRKSALSDEQRMALINNLTKKIKIKP